MILTELVKRYDTEEIDGTKYIPVEYINDVVKEVSALLGIVLVPYN